MIVEPQSTQASPVTTTIFIDEKPVPVPRPGRWVAVVVLIVLVAWGVYTLGFEKIQRGTQMQTRFGWEIVGQYFLTPNILNGLLVTLELTAAAMVIGIVGGIVLAVMRLSTNPILSSASALYIWLFRGTPVLVQLLLWYNLSYMFPQINLGIPFGPTFVSLNANTMITPFLAALLGLGLHEAAYMCEIVRAGILSVDEGQEEAAQSLGMSRRKTMLRIILPQAMKVIIPPTGSQTIGMLKMSSLASVITVVELLRSVQLIYASTYDTIPLLIVASLWYLVVTSILTVGQYYVERHYSRGSSRNQPLTPVQRLRRMFGDFHPGVREIRSNPQGGQS
ncbi:amino acid ABC transporter permease [Microbacterium capsulatum]|uniref:Amino acid ABC transporter permease n=1 Tax=Microbacterium capsulatum TaxID=3041921 RepID=A0ABU0XML2_9MICO|nr:amino acid ABC transporter permease [Microbacterium sp. ASV81]MDQ4214970.1 amino acid ABC transporter permease [Microbacterium sp. ASV81]